LRGRRSLGLTFGTRGICPARAGELAAYDIGLLVDVSSLRVTGGTFDFSVDGVTGV
jgi:hypothetical protein